MKIRQYLVISDKDHREFVDTIVQISRKYMAETSSDIISIIPVDADNLIVTDIVSLGMIDGIIFCPYVKAGYIGRLLNMTCNIADLTVITNAIGDFIGQLDLVLDGNKPGDVLKFKCDKFIMSVVCTEFNYNHTNINMTAYNKKPRALNNPPRTPDNDIDPNFGILYNIFIPCGQKINVEMNKEILKAEKDFQDASVIM